ncbi:TlpA family protein disulfide reductase [Flagellimonas flava]|uniref:Thiol-disulfide isomerase or thioredoxin n=1 Tax=Flagellimonas flava TaxID=570519 RepID=A0A1M5PN85_9FLAO|nr:TlpA disulfide reductase family protein [Allomuricauda flava]SHH03214.1 Thiol-disulfide isomerase or thioredoxin [Allomuricauda flava]
MKLSKEQIGNVVWIVVILLILFTPIGFHLKVFVGKLFSGTADVIAVEDREMLESYNWQLQDMKGNPVNFKSFENEVVLVNFWATWCPPCVAEMPSLARLHSDYKDRVIFAFVASDEKIKVSKFLDKKGYSFPVYFENTKTPDVLVSSSIPATYILDKKGKVVVKEIGAAKWDAQSTRDLLDQLLAEDQ